MDLTQYEIGFVGFGHLGSTLFDRFIATQLIRKEQCRFVRQNIKKQHETSTKLSILPSTVHKIFQRSDIILLCVPPQNIADVMQDAHGCALENKLIISTLAGVKLQYFEKSLLGKTQLMRVMPNVPSLIGEGITAVSYNDHITSDNKALGVLLMTALGIVIEIEEKYMDAACGICGSGPAFVFKLIQATIEKAQEEGMPQDIALKMASQMFAGAGKLALKEKSLDTLLSSIQSPKGTTQAGVKKFEALDVSTSFKKVLSASIDRSKEISAAVK
ncbi:MAG: pyrroline-5-carboxylate reductase [Chlamydiae bacterium CG10_big_fil_rev_8_21_14_0_10_35_9]|nr:MAG: pyrroline-5-carboxylate reductase [Chlamydiae bacterium CG10_big_fil_rev_8_21_14_0_10_35_9]